MKKVVIIYFKSKFKYELRTPLIKVAGIALKDRFDLISVMVPLSYLSCYNCRSFFLAQYHFILTLSYLPNFYVMCLNILLNIVSFYKNIFFAKKVMFYSNFFAKYSLMLYLTSLPRMQGISLTFMVNFIKI